MTPGVIGERQVESVLRNSAYRARVRDDGPQYRDDRLDVSLSEYCVRSMRCTVGIGRLVEARRLHDSVGGEFVDNEVDEHDLIRGKSRAVQKHVERLDGGFPIKSDQRSDEQSQAVGVLLGALD